MRMPNVCSRESRSSHLVTSSGLVRHQAVNYFGSTTKSLSSCSSNRRRIFCAAVRSERALMSQDFERWQGRAENFTFVSSSRNCVFRTLRCSDLACRGRSLTDRLAALFG